MLYYSIRWYLTLLLWGVDLDQKFETRSTTVALGALGEGGVSRVHTPPSKPCLVE